MNDAQCVQFLQWALPHLGMRWAGYRKVRRQVCNRARRRAGDLGLPDLNAYRTYLDAHPEEWGVLDGLTPITISRFYRDRGTFELLAHDVLPALAAQALGRGRDTLEVWSAGCASGEEPYTLAIIWELELAAQFPELTMRILATDIHPAMLARTRRACFTAGSLRELPEPWRAAAFVREDAFYCLRDPYRQAVTVTSHDIRSGPPDGPFDLILCRNLVFTYFDEDVQHETAVWLVNALRPGGALVLGAHEQLPEELLGVEPWDADRGVYRRVSALPES
jgi:chemotaxis protein methyltransferase CheR